MLELKAESRKELGRKANTLRRKGFLPAVVYGEKVISQSISIPLRDFEKAYREAGESTILKLEVSSDGKKENYNVLIHDIRNDPLKGNPIHADFYVVRMDKKITTDVPIKFIGESPAVKGEGGILVKVLQEVEVEALPADLPHELGIDVSRLAAIEDQLTVKDIVLPRGVEITNNPEDVIVLVEPPRSEEELESLKETPLTGELSEIKTEQEVKKEEKSKEEVENQEAEKTEKETDKK